MTHSAERVDTRDERSRLIPKKLLQGITPSAMLRWHRRRKETREIQAFSRRYVTHRYGDLDLRILLADPTAQAWYDHDWAWPPELTLLRQGQLRDGAVVFNAGAHQGLIAMLLAASVGPQGRVFAAELNKHNAGMARTNCRENGVQNVQVLHAAVTDGGTTVRVDGRLNGRILGAARGRKGSGVTALTLDALSSAQGMPQVLYIDVEGHEARVLRGAPQTLAARPDCFVEVHVGCGLEENGSTVADVMQHFPLGEYELFAGRQDEPCRPIADFPPAIFESRFFLVAMRRTQ